MDSGTRSALACAPCAWRGRRSPSPPRRVGLTPAGRDRGAPATRRSPRPRPPPTRSTDRIGDLAGQLTAAQDAVDAAHADLGDRARRLPGHRRPPTRPRSSAPTPPRPPPRRPPPTSAWRASEVVAFARRSYMQGSTYPGAAALITAADPGELIERAALLEAAGAHRSDVLDQVTVLQAAGRRGRGGRAHRRRRGRPRCKEQAAAALEVAQARRDLRPRSRPPTLGAAAGAARRPSWPRRSSSCAALVGAAGGRRRRRPRPPPARRRRRAAGRHRAPAARQPGPGRARARASAAQTAIDAAMGYLGTPYAWGGGGSRGPGPGLDPDEGVIGFDCSGLTQYAYAQAGISIPRNSRAQYAALPKVSATTCRPATSSSGRPTRATRRRSTTWRSTWAAARSCRRRRAATSSRCRPCGGGLRGRGPPQRLTAARERSPGRDVEASGSHGGSCPTRDQASSRLPARAGVRRDPRDSQVAGASAWRRATRSWLGPSSV